MPQSFVKSLLRLNWTSVPSPLLPHGLCGAIGLLCGTVLVGGSLAGSYAAVRSWLLPIYLVASTASAVSGYASAGRAPRWCREIFKHAAWFQVCLIYHSWRFFENREAPPALLDMFFAAATILGIVLFATRATAVAGHPVVAVSIIVGSFALSLLAGYPLQLAIGGQEWWSCVQEKYPLQALGMVAYIYVPTVWTFSAMVFGATLWLRRLIGDIVFGGGFILLILLTLFGTVIMQEVHIPSPASTQRLYLPCPDPEPHSWRAWAVDALDTSVLAQGVLRVIRGPAAP